jgi:hypothetical protein
MDRVGKTAIRSVDFAEVPMKAKASQEQLMKVIRKNLVSVAALQQQSRGRGAGIDREMKKIEAELKRIAQGFERAPDRSRGHRER